MILTSQRTTEKSKLACICLSLPRQITSRLGPYSWSSWIARSVEPRRFIQRLPVGQPPVKHRMLTSKCTAYCHNQQVSRIRIRIYVGKHSFRGSIAHNTC